MKYTISIVNHIQKELISKTFLCFWIASFLFLSSNQSLFAQNIPTRPSPARLVNDLVGVLSPEEKENLERKLVKYDDSTSTQITVVIVKSTGDYTIDDVALKILREWGVGEKGKNNGIVILAAIEDRRINIQTGYGMEGVLPDGICKRIINQDIIPAFKTKSYYDGFDKATSSIIKRASGEYVNDNQSESVGSEDIIIFLFILMFIIFIIAQMSRKSQGMVVTRRGYTNWDGGGWWYMPGGGGRSSWGDDDWNNRGGGSGGGGFDFGGFGGGDGGGGGASGDW
jgi:uncharacterized protein